MAVPNLLRSKQRVADISRLSKLALDSAARLKNINYEVQNGIIDFNQLDFIALGLDELDPQQLADGAAAGQTIIDNYTAILTRLAAYAK
jgi:hypothetical protein